MFALMFALIFDSVIPLFCFLIFGCFMEIEMIRYA